MKKQWWLYALLIGGLFGLGFQSDTALATGSYCQIAGSSNLTFDGVNDFVNLGNQPSIQLSGDMAISAWVKLNAGTTGQYLGIAGKLNNAQGFSLVRHENNRFRFWIANGFSFTGLDSSTTYTDTDWHYVTAVLQNGSARLYVDGQLHSQGGSNLTIADSGQFAHIGRQYSNFSGRYFAGQIDDVRFYNRALNAGEVTAGMSSFPIIPDPGLAGYWNLNEGQGQIVYDLSGNNNQGYLGNNANVENSDPMWSPTGCVTQNTWYVSAFQGSDNNSGLSPQSPFATIQRGINASSNGDTVNVAPGIYVGSGNKNLDFGGREITVQSSNGPENTVIDCQGNGRGFVFQNGETHNAVVDGLTITNGNMDRAGGIYCFNSSPTIMNCIVKSNQGTLASGIYCRDNSDAMIIRCRVINNQGQYNGGIRIVRSHTQVLNCVIAGNTSTEGGAGVRCDYGPGNPVIENCTITDNTALGNGGGLWAGFGSNPTVKNSIIWDNVSNTQGQNVAVSTQSTLTINYSDVKGGQSGVYKIGDGQLIWGQGNITLDPLFANPGQGDYHLRSLGGRYVDVSSQWVVDNSHSPCIDAGDPASDVGDEPEPNGGRINMGAYGGTEKASLSHEGGGGGLDLPGDVNGDGQINLSDLFTLIDLWLSQYGNSI